MRYLFLIHGKAPSCAYIISPSLILPAPWKTIRYICLVIYSEKFALWDFSQNETISIMSLKRSSAWPASRRDDAVRKSSYEAAFWKAGRITFHHNK